MRSILLRSIPILSVLLPFFAVGVSGFAAERPNIVWVVIEDMSPHFRCYGERTIATPNIDRLATEGVKFTRAYVTAPVCSTCRSALVTGMYQTTIGAHQHRSGRGELKIHLPPNVRLIPEYFRDAGYWTANLASPEGGKRLGKTDYNFEWDRRAYDGGDWSGRAAGQPFFAQVQLHGGKYRSGAGWRKRVKETLGSVTSPEDVTLPPYYPDDPVILQDWADYLDTVRWTDHEVGQLMERLQREGVLDNTYVFLITDHGISHARGKQFCYEEGVHIPLIVRGPGLKAGTVRDDLVLQIDMAATSLALADIAIPEYLQSVDLFAKDYRPREYVVVARDRCDETVDRIRGVVSRRFEYIRNFYPERPYLQPNAYKDGKEILVRLRELHAAGKLDQNQLLVFAETRPVEELYDLERDPFELHNLAGDPFYGDVLRRHRGYLEEWIVETDDRGAAPEGAMYDSDMAVYLKAIVRRHPERVEIIRRNIEQMKAWAAAGK